MSFLPGWNGSIQRLVSVSVSIYICVFLLKGKLVDIKIKSLLAQIGNFVNDFRKTERLMKGMTFSSLGYWLIVVGHRFISDRQWSLMP